MQEVLFLSFPLDRLKLEISEAVKQELDKHFHSSKTDHTQSELLSRTQTAQMLSVSLPTLHTWTKTDIIKAYRIGTRVRYRKSDIENALLQINNRK